MGVDISATFAFGLSLTDEEAYRLPWRSGSDGESHSNAFDGIEGWIVSRAGLDSAPFAEQNAAVEAYPLTEVSHCCGLSHMMYFLAIRGTTGRCDLGKPKAIPVEAMQNISNGDILELRGFCEEFGIEWREPQWWVGALQW